MLIRPVQGPAFEGQDYAFLLAVLIFVHLRPSSSIFSTSRFHVFCSLNHVTLVFVYLSIIDMIT